MQLAMFRHRPALLEYISGKLPAKLARLIDPHDILQDVYIEMGAALTTWSGDSSDALLRAMKTTARNNIVNLVLAQRTAKRGGGNVVTASELNQRSAEVLIETLVRYDRTPSTSAMSHEFSALLQKSIDSLSPDESKALRLRYLSGLSLKDVGEQMSRSCEAAEQLCRRAVVQLRRQLVPTAMRN